MSKLYTYFGYDSRKYILKTLWDNVKNSTSQCVTVTQNMSHRLLSCLPITNCDLSQATSWCALTNFLSAQFGVSNMTFLIFAYVVLAWCFIMFISTFVNKLSKSIIVIFTHWISNFVSPFENYLINLRTFLLGFLNWTLFIGKPNQSKASAFFKSLPLLGSTEMGKYGRSGRSDCANFSQLR